MSRWIALSRSEHAKACYLPRQGYAHAAQDRVAPILVSELPRLLPHYVLGFIQSQAKQDKNQSETDFLPVALLGTTLGQNLYLNPDNRWLADYAPALLRGFPFALGTLPQKDEDGNAVLRLREDHLLAEGQGGEPLMTDLGELTEAVAHTARFLQHCQRDLQRTLMATRKLESAGLLQPWPLEVKSAPDAEPVTLSGLYKLDQAKLEALTDEVYASLKGPAMTLAYAQLFSSTHQGEQLTKRAALQEKLAEAQTLPMNRDSFFGISDDDDSILSFDQ